MTKVRKNFDEGIQLDPSIEDGTREGEIWVDSRDNKAKIFLDGVIQEFTTSNPDNASAVSYNNASSGLNATNTQNALEELAIELQRKVDLIPMITSLEFITQPSTSNPGEPMADIVVEVRDQFGQLYPADSSNFLFGNITLSIDSGPVGATITGNLEASPINGQITFSGITLSTLGDYVLKAEGINLFGFTTVEGFSSNITVELAPPAITSIELTGFPTTGTAGQPLTTFTAVIKDQYGDVYQTDGSDIGNGVIYIDYFTGPGSGPGQTPVGGTNFASPVDINGVSTFTFDNIILDPDATYTLEVVVFNSNFSQRTAVITPSIVIAEAPTITSLQVTTQPTNTFEGEVISPTIRVQLKDQFNNNIVGTNPITATLYQAGSPVGGGILSGTLTVSANSGNGRADFSDLSISQDSNNYIIRFSSPGLPDVDSSPFNILGTPVLTSLQIEQPPTDTFISSNITPSPTVRLKDQYNNNMTTSGVGLTASSPGLAGGGSESLITTNGLGTFTNLIASDTAGSYTMTFTSYTDPATTPDTANFNVTLPASQFVITQQPLSALEGASMTPSFIIQARDSANQLVSSYNGTVSVSITNNPSGGSLSGTTSVTLSNGQATFSDLSINNPGVGYTLTFSDGSLTDAVTSGITINQRVATSLDIIQQPSNTTPDTTISPAITVQIKDQGNNNITGTNAITATLSSGSFSLGTTTVNAVNGLATFSDLQISTVGSYTITFSSAGLNSDISNNFNIQLDYNNLTWTDLNNDPNLTTSTTPTSITTVNPINKTYDYFTSAYINQFIPSGDFRIQFNHWGPSGIDPVFGGPIDVIAGSVRLYDPFIPSDTFNVNFYNNGDVQVSGPVSSGTYPFWQQFPNVTRTQNTIFKIELVGNEYKFYADNILKATGPRPVDYPVYVQFQPSGMATIGSSSYTNISITPI